MSQELVKYDAMCHAIAECHRVDEVTELHNKARALELYARQAKNTDAERKACEIRLRAERRAGELFLQMERGTAGRPAKEIAPTDGANTEYQQGIESAQVSPQTARRWQELATVPAAQFEDALRAPDKPSTSAIIAKAKSAPKMDGDALWLWGRARDFERERFSDKCPAELLAGMTDTMRADMERIVPMMAAFFNEFAEAFEHERA